MFAEALRPANAAPARCDRDGLHFIKILVLCLFVAAAISRAVQRDFRQGFDEVAHVSYVAHLQQTGEASPDFAAMRLLDPETFHFMDLPNYLNHPSPYYWLLARLGPKVEGNPRSLVILRLINIVIAASGFCALLMLSSGDKRSKIEEYAWYLPLLAIPMLPSIAGAANNDNPAFLGGALALLASQRLLATREGAWLIVALAGLIVAGLAKLTGLLLVGGLIAGVLATMISRGDCQPSWIGAAVIAALVAASPYVALWVQYGGPAPDTPGQIELLKSTAPPDLGWEHAPRLSFLGFAAKFAQAFFIHWVPTPRERNALQYAVLAAPVFAIFCAMAGAWISGRRLLRKRETPDDVLIVAGFATLCVTLACHLVFSYRHHVAYAYLADAYPRYYLPLIGIVPLAGLSALSAMRESRAKTILTAILIGGPLAVSLFGIPI
ncbi:hypothetical protein [Methylocystis parvus]|uniref:DUF2142 domain-containing protein n=1 Tax=Methylocystis parvus TaxID=134 RepID=A0A6B8M6T7_9HYPH|nr:hypothetical protein [Methylocystis parvus]QGM98561.1 hypothetical protein F7D14_14475 [Methylocystis parvus]WBK01097.1 hypothetical protein MMG94_05095 [Methylocystis parvus OBBP]